MVKISGLFAGLLAMAACSPASAPPQPAAKPTQALGELTDAQAEAAIAALYNRDACLQLLFVEHIEVEDRRVSGDTAQVQAIVSLRTTPRYHQLGLIDECATAFRYGKYTAIGQAFGPNKAVRLRDTYSFQRWESGWKIVSPWP